MLTRLIHWLFRREPEQPWHASGYRYVPGMEKADRRFQAVPGDVQRAIEKHAASVREGLPVLWTPGDPEPERASKPIVLN